MRQLFPVGLGLLALGEAVAGLRNLTEQEPLVAGFYLLAALGFGVAAGTLGAHPASPARTVAAWALAVVLLARLGRVASYPLGQLPGWLLGVLFLGAAGLALLAAAGFARARIPPAPWSRGALVAGFALEGTAFAWLLTQVVPPFPAILTPLLAMAGATCAALAAWRTRADRAELAAGA